jgi:cytochrome c biogenesis factor
MKLKSWIELYNFTMGIIFGCYYFGNLGILMEGGYWTTETITFFGGYQIGIPVENASLPWLQISRCA